MKVYKRRIACCVLTKAWLHLVWLVYRFDRWHATAPICCRPYKAQVVDLASSLRPESVLEIGCGLGEIVSRIDSPRRFGADIDRGVLRAAAALHGGVRYAAASLEDSQGLGALTGGRAEVLVMVNWPHTVAFDVLAPAITALHDLLGLRYLIMDAIVEGTPGYRHSHTPAQLSSLGEVVESRLAADGVRWIHLLRLRRSGTADCLTDGGVQA